MKTNKKLISIFSLALVLWLAGCESIEPAEDLKLLDPTNVDADAGTWTMILPVAVDHAPFAAAASNFEFSSF